jgi:polyisoprenoid-binding protein YceI
MKKMLYPALIILALIGLPVHAANYVIDTEKAHAFIEFKISHLGFSFVKGRFNSFSGEFSYDENDPSASKVSVNIDTSSIDTNYAERDKHLKSADFLDVSKYPTATFTSTSFKELGNGKARLSGNLTLHGVTKPIMIDVTEVGAGKDPWGGYRRGFTGVTTLKLKDFGIDYNLGPAATEVEIQLSLEGIRK